MKRFIKNKSLLIIVCFITLFILILTQFLTYLKVIHFNSNFLILCTGICDLILFIGYFVLGEAHIDTMNEPIQKQNVLANKFLSSLGHTLRTPLTPIMGYTQTLLAKFAGPLTSEQETQLQAIKKNATLLLSLINNAMDIVNIDAGNVVSSAEKISCQNLIKTILSPVLPIAEKKGLEVIVDLPDKEIFLQTDTKIVSKILSNLINNAINFTEKGSIKIKLHTAMLNGVNKTVFDIIDTGIGISESDMQKLFTSVGTLATATHITPESGWSLYLSNKLAHLINAEITIESKLGEGSRFSLEIPIKAS